MYWESWCCSRKPRNWRQRRYLRKERYATISASTSPDAAKSVPMACCMPTRIPCRHCSMRFGDWCRISHCCRTARRPRPISVRHICRASGVPRWTPIDEPRKVDGGGRAGGGVIRRVRLACRRRSEERRVGKECRSRWSPYHYKKTNREEIRLRRYACQICLYVATVRE